MADVFRFLVYAIAALALLSIFYMFILPLFYPPADTLGEVQGFLDSAELNEGKAFTKENWS